MVIVGNIAEEAAGHIQKKKRRVKKRRQKTVAFYRDESVKVFEMLAF